MTRQNLVEGAGGVEERLECVQRGGASRRGGRSVVDGCPGGGVPAFIPALRTTNKPFEWQPD